jgi:sterol 3beta-glucosyltransferase
MRILLLILGTRGDVQPFVALGKRLQHAGHDVAVCASSGFAPWIKEHGLGYANMNNDIVDLVNSDAGRRTMEGAGRVAGLPKLMLESARRFKSIFRRALAEQWEAAKGAQVIIYNPNAVGGYHIAEALGIVGIMTDAIPTWVPTGSFPHIVTPDLKLGSWYNRLTHRLVGVVPRLLFGSVVSRGRKETWRPPPRLLEFLDAGPPPVFVGFGSMVGGDPAKRARVALDALAQSGQRGLVVTGWGGLSVPDPPQSAHVTEFVPYDWLLPRVAAVVHHGGAGTTAAGLRAGKPTVICPFVLV